MRQIIAVAPARLAQRDPGHAAVVRAEINLLGSRNASGGTGATVVVVFELSDGDVRAVGVGHPIPLPGQEHDPRWVAVDYGPMR
jgi:hypothetical protein